MLSGKKKSGGQKVEKDEKPHFYCLAPDGEKKDTYVSEVPLTPETKDQGNVGQKADVNIFDSRGSLCTEKADGYYTTIVRKDAQTLYTSPRLAGAQGRRFTVYHAQSWRATYGED